MPINIANPAAVAAKWVKRASAAGADYTTGVQNPRTDQAQAAAAAAPVWAQAVANAASNGTYAKGVNKTGTAKWQQNASTIGAQRYPQGVTAAQNSYATAEAPYLQVLANLNLPPRGVKGTNNARVQAVVDALIKAKQSQ